MAVNLSIKNVPEPLAEALRRRAAENHRSLQGELMSILESAVAGPRVVTPAQLLAETEAAGLRTADEATAMIRADRDAR